MSLMQTQVHTLAYPAARRGFLMGRGAGWSSRAGVLSPATFRSPIPPGNRIDVGPLLPLGLQQLPLGWAAERRPESS